MTIDYSLITVQDAVYLLCNNDGYCDGDKKCVVINSN